MPFFALPTTQFSMKLTSLRIEAKLNK